MQTYFDVLAAHPNQKAMREFISLRIAANRYEVTPVQLFLAYQPLTVGIGDEQLEAQALILGTLDFIDNFTSVEDFDAACKSESAADLFA
jgi:hypothetical protein